MKTITIHSKVNESVVYEGFFHNHAACLEAALMDGAALNGADLRRWSLPHANLDGADFTGAVLDDCDFTGANLSEADLTSASLRRADLSLAVLSESRMVDCDLHDASFAGTLINDALIDQCRFSCPSALSLSFGEARLGLNYYGPHAFTTAPVIVSGLPKRIVFLDEVVLIGDAAYKRAEFPNPFEGLFGLTEPEISLSSHGHGPLAE